MVPVALGQGVRHAVRQRPGSAGAGLQLDDERFHERDEVRSVLRVALAVVADEPLAAAPPERVHGLRRHIGCLVRPVLDPHARRVVQECVQPRPRIRPQPREEGEVVGSGDGLDGIDLDDAQAFEHPAQVARVGPPRTRAVEAGGGERDAPRRLGRQGRRATPMSRRQDVASALSGVIVSSRAMTP